MTADFAPLTAGDRAAWDHLQWASYGTFRRRPAWEEEEASRTLADIGDSGAAWAGSTPPTASGTKFPFPTCRWSVAKRRQAGSGSWPDACLAREKRWRTEPSRP